MKNDQLTTAISVLNEALKADPLAVQALFRNRVPCNQTLAEHPTIQVSSKSASGPHDVGLLGLINGLVEPLTGGRIAAILDDSEPCEGKIQRFDAYTGPAQEVT
jgi:hypothetical protein